VTTSTPEDTSCQRPSFLLSVKPIAHETKTPVLQSVHFPVSCVWSQFVLLGSDRGSATVLLIRSQVPILCPLSLLGSFKGPIIVKLVHCFSRYVFCLVCPKEGALWACLAPRAPSKFQSILPVCALSLLPFPPPVCRRSLVSECLV
jgi:hypothetical protein